MFFRKKSPVPEMKRLDLRLGDRLVVTTPQPLNAEQRAHMVRELKRWAPIGVTVLVLDAGVELTVLSDTWHPGSGRNPIPQPGS